MRRLLPVGISALAALLCFSEAHAVVLFGRVSWVGPIDADPDQYQLRHQFSELPSYDYAVFDVVTSSTLKSSQITLGGNYKAFVAPEGTEFTLDYIASHTALINNSGTGNPPYGFGNQFTVALGQSVFLAISHAEPGVPSSTQFGWVKLTNVGGIIQMAGEATSIGSGGIIVGTLTEVPEPSSVCLVAGAALFSFRRRRR